MIAEQLKKAIYQSAIQGKLTKQYEMDGHAKDLLKKIEDSKKNQITKGKIRNEFSFSKIDNDEVPFEIPDNWVWCRLGECLDVRDGTHDTPKYVRNGIPLITGKNISGGKLEFENIKFISKADAEKINSRSKVDVNDILFAMIGSIGNPIIVEDEREFCIKNLALFKNINNLLNMNYMLIFFLYIQESLKTQASGGVQKFISLDYFRKLLVPLPPLVEQERIVQQIEVLLPKIDILKSDEVKLENLQREFPNKIKNSILKYAFQGKLTKQLSEDVDAHIVIEENLNKDISFSKSNKVSIKSNKSELNDDIPFDIPANWCWMKLGEIGKWSSGATPLKSKKDYYENGTIPWIKTGDLNNSFIYESPEHITDKALKETSVKLFPKGTVLIAMYGATIGKLGILGIEATTNQACCGCIVFDGVYNKYLFYYLMSQKNEFINQGVGGAQPNISKEKIIKNFIPIPPYKEQIRIVNLLEEVLCLCDTLI